MGAPVSPPYPAPGPPSARKRKHVTGSNPGGGSRGSDHTTPSSSTPSKKAKLLKPPNPTGEKRLRRFRAQPPQSFTDVYNRATTQRFYVLSRASAGDSDCPEEVVELTGSTGNIYKVHIARQPTCDCPHGREGNQCKHQLYVLARVLRAKFEYVYQLALLSTELQEIFANAPPRPDVGRDASRQSSTGQARKPIEGDCPICFCEMEVESGEGVVWCRAACGQNIHQECFEKWAATKRQQGTTGGSAVTCPYCRSVWEGDGDIVSSIKKTGKANADGYVNIAGQLGLSTRRDYSTYSRFWSGHPNSFRRRY